MDEDFLSESGLPHLSSKFQTLSDVLSKTFDISLKKSDTT